MRNCPVCESPERETRFRQTFLVPEGWPMPPYLDWCVCRSCGMIYGDHPDASQAMFDEYYKTKYGFGVEDDAARKRQIALADTAKQGIQKDALIVDFGGGEGVLTKKLRNYGFHNVVNTEAGEPLPSGIDVLYAEHVLEHIYDLPGAMRQISSALKVGGLVVMDGPEAGGIAAKKATPMLDWHIKHINHFTLFDYMHMFQRHGFAFLSAATYIERMHPCVHMSFGKTLPDYVYDQSVQHITGEIAKLVQKLDELGDKEVILWGCGDLALHCLSLHMINVRYFVDKDPAFRGAKIAGLPVFSTVQEDDATPILVVATSQKQSILDNIRAEQKNKSEVIVL